MQCEAWTSVFNSSRRKLSITLAIRPIAGWPNPRGGPAIPANLGTFNLLTPEYVTAVAP